MIWNIHIVLHSVLKSISGKIAKMDWKILTFQAHQNNYTVIIYFVLSSTVFSMFATYLSVSFCTSCSNASTSSSEISLALFIFLNASFASLLMFRMATFAFSPFFFMSFASSFLLSSVSSGNTSQITFPSFVGLIPISEFRIAFSISLIRLLTHG